MPKATAEVTVPVEEATPPPEQPPVETPPEVTPLEIPAEEPVAGETPNEEPLSEEPSAFEKWSGKLLGDIEKLPADEQEAAWSGLFDKLTPEQRQHVPVFREREAEALRTRATDEGRRRAQELGERSAAIRERQGSALAAIGNHIQGVLDPIVDPDNQLTPEQRAAEIARLGLDGRVIARNIQEFAESRAVELSSDRLVAVANVVVSEVQRAGEALTQEDVDRIMEDAKDARGVITQPGAVAAYQRELVRRTENRLRAEFEVEKRAAVDLALKQERGALRNEVLADLEVAPRGAEGEPSPGFDSGDDPNRVLASSTTTAAQKAAAFQRKHGFSLVS